MAIKRRASPIQDAVSVPVSDTPAVPVETLPETPPSLKLVASGCNLLEPHELVWFHDGKPREVYRLTKWMQAQIDAGLLKQV